MILSMEEVRKFKNGKEHPGKYIYDLFDTIEAQQQEIEQYIAWNEAHTKARAEQWEKIKQLLGHVEGQVEAMRIILQDMVDVARACACKDYHNPADVEALQLSREALDCALFWTRKHEHTASSEQIEEALAAIEKQIGGQEDV